MLAIKWMRGAGLALVVLTMGLLVVGCSPGEDAPAVEPDFDKLEQRVRDRWAILSAKDFGGAWEFSTPNYRRNFPKELFMRNFSYTVDWELTGVEVVNYDADAAVASVAARVMSKPAKQTASSSTFGAIPITFRESWIFQEGEWWHSANIK
jgi:hypothetical protein